MQKCMTGWLVMVAAVCLSGGDLRGDVILTLGDYELNPGESIVIPITATTTEDETGCTIDFYAEIYGGEAGKTPPSFASVSFVGTVFEGAPIQETTVTGTDAYEIVTPQKVRGALASYFDIFSGGTNVDLAGCLINITVDATGADPGVWSLKVLGVDLEDSPPPYDTRIEYYTGLPFPFLPTEELSVVAGDGHLTVVPEPTSLALLMVGAGAAAAHRRRKSRLGCSRESV